MEADNNVLDSYISAHDTETFQSPLTLGMYSLLPQQRKSKVHLHSLEPSNKINSRKTKNQQTPDHKTVL